jgi:universal stress protein A
MFAPKKILVPTDFSEFSDSALAQAVDIGTQYGSTIYLLHVIGIVQQCTYDYCLPADTVEDVRIEGVKSAQEMMQEQIRRAGKPGEVQIVPDIREGTPPYEEILREQKAKDVDLIVIATHGKTGLLHYLMGSVAEKVTRGATCPVYLVKGTKSASTA